MSEEKNKTENQTILRVSGVDYDDYKVTLNGKEVKHGEPFHAETGDTITLSVDKRDFTVETK